MQGPTEILPVSSSGHTALLPAVLGWPYARLPAAHRKAFEVALHAGAAAGIAAAAVRGRGSIGQLVAAPRGAGGDPLRRSVIAGAMTLPAVLCGLAFGRPIEERLGGRRSVAVAQIIGGAALWGSDRLPARRAAPEMRPADALVLGVGQAAALAPGVSRAGGVLVAARALRFRRPDAVALSWRGALPVLAGATGLKSTRLALEGLPRELASPFAAGGLAALVSTYAFSPLAGRTASARSLAPIAAYRIALGGVTLLALRDRAKGRRPAAPRGVATTIARRARAPRAPGLRPRRGQRSRRHR